ncbi:hypothetical protein [Polyangium sp. y55x31]|uniref:hypothetical protein n=1 Tax=Polyangium sp. y55x31 TaxID=3042688 RepID=UPI0024821F7F|nr:hypothetical protein [Polyangium sp. y55x31]MDI1479265.1 hypothetical protein [Polyangium sp. y55x31]
MKKQNKVTTKKAGKKAPGKKALIQSLVKKDLESLASSVSAVSCGGTTCWNSN